VVVTAAWVWSRVTGAFDPRAEAMPYILWGVLGGLCDAMRPGALARST